MENISNHFHLLMKLKTVKYLKFVFLRKTCQYQEHLRPLLVGTWSIISNPFRLWSQTWLNHYSIIVSQWFFYSLKLIFWMQNYSTVCFITFDWRYMYNIHIHVATKRYLCRKKLSISKIWQTTKWKNMINEFF